eukprot:SAG25_NODE_437_length_8033_cov_16.194199_8_plen_100_part_00
MWVYSRHALAPWNTREPCARSRYYSLLIGRAMYVVLRGFCAASVLAPICWKHVLDLVPTATAARSRRTILFSERQTNWLICCPAAMIPEKSAYFCKSIC